MPDPRKLLEADKVRRAPPRRAAPAVAPSRAPLPPPRYEVPEEMAGDLEAQGYIHGLNEIERMDREEAARRAAEEERRRQAIALSERMQAQGRMPSVQMGSPNRQSAIERLLSLLPLIR